MDRVEAFCVHVEMLTPTFQLQQSPTHILIQVKAPNLSTSDVEYVVTDEHVFRLYARPYFLRLTFSLPLDSCDMKDSMHFDAEKSALSISIGKKNEGEFFPDLNMITKLLSKPSEVRGEPQPERPLIEVLSSSFNDLRVSEDETFDWVQVQVGTTQDGDSLMNSDVFLTGPIHYGFNWSQSGLFPPSTSVLNLGEHAYADVIDLPTPDSTPVRDRIELCRAQELKDFSPDHYVHDLAHPFPVRQCMEFRPAFLQGGEFAWTEKEKLELTRLPRKEFLVDRPRDLWMVLIDLLLGYVYDVRLRLGEENSESAWNLSKICSSLSWLAVPESLEQVIIGFFRRVLTYPLYRSFDLARRCLEDVVFLVSQKQWVLRVLLEMDRIFRVGSDSRSIFSTLFTRDYCVWVQRVAPRGFGIVSGRLALVVRQGGVLRKEAYEDFCLLSIEKFFQEECQGFAPEGERMGDDEPPVEF